MGEQSSVPQLHASGGPPVVQYGAFNLLAETWGRALERWVLETPIPAALAVFLVAIIVAEVLRRTGRGRGGLIALAAGVLLGAGVITLGTLIETPSELLTRRTKEFTSAIVAADEPKVAAMIDPAIDFRSAGSIERFLNHDWLLSVVRGFKGVIKSNSIEPTDSDVDSDSAGRTRFIARSVLDSGYPGQIVSSWELTWRKEKGGDWKITSVECLTLENASASSEWAVWASRYRR